MKKIVTSFVASLALASALNAAEIYATVDGENITKQDIEMIIQDPRIDLDKIPAEARTQVVDQAINKKLLAKKAIKDGIEKDAQYVEAIGKIKEDLAFQVWQKNEVDKLKFSDAEKKDFYEKNKDKFNIPETFEASHILVDTEAEAQSIINDLNKASNKEAKFKELAKAKSKDPSKSNGGYLGKFAAEQMVPEFANAVKLLTKGGYSKSPVKSQFGYHVILLKDKFPGKVLAYNEVEGEINQVLIGNSFGKKVKELIENLRKDAKIVIK
ncbi:major antigenic peptide / PpiC-type peptidyl-prolyl cis-trans isomerase [Aliarcobacter faecis]|uniref:peptidylprolyl isomerase n=1 Tax=Aliarcobacter faecis TaxID=1564138 RepID=UPI00047E22D8|nr:peptidylprolyl isomerase [Aliarcobacter faecis]QKF74015.1 major antigenic peptide / PpiC-type peptidyl-prolyl cis-trans isomerase [Aliarcobacter faecis]